ncbi:hypothetical protein [Nocardioides albus]|uniref:Uncharacterized protein n=1 Tax=Nocardioides albus TaxID=1841 RepID=A0A7W5A9N5_9ACTN|nr:hypothetical protein [Nocardioides albus]MBB3092151.1 hypothetical protein [Nocardioides albus]GGU46244.1 hypothetical protein GCM10007979_51760 [Nocardioides albus]
MEDRIKAERAANPAGLLVAKRFIGRGQLITADEVVAEASGRLPA